MTYRFRQSFTSGNRRAAVAYVEGIGEFRVRLYVDGVAQPEADYFTDDRHDADATALAMVQFQSQSD